MLAASPATNTNVWESFSAGNVLKSLFSSFAFALGTIPNGGTVQLSVMAHVDAVATYTSTADVTANENDAQLSNNSASATVNAIAADVEVVSLGTTSMLAGAPAYTVNVINHGPSPANAVVVTDRLDRFVYVASSTTQGSCTFAASTVTCQIGTLASGATATVMVAVSAPSRGWAAHDFSALASTPDPNLNNNAAHIGPSYDSFNTFAGSNVTVRLDSAGVEVVYSSVDRVGATAVSMMSPGSMPPPPAGFRAGNPAVVYDVSSSALFSGPIALTFAFQPSWFHKPAKLRLFHLESGVWVDCSAALDATGRITGRTTSLSPFALFEPLNAAPVANAGAARALPAIAASIAAALLLYLSLPALRIDFWSKPGKRLRHAPQLHSQNGTNIPRLTFCCYSPRSPGRR